MKTTLLWLSISLTASLVQCKLIDVPIGIPGITVQLKEKYLLYPSILSEINQSERRCCKLEPASEVLQEEIRRYLAPKLSTKLAEKLGQHDELEPVKAQRLFQYLIENFVTTQVIHIFKNAIDEIYNEIPIRQLAQQLYALYQPENPQIYEVISQAQLYLYWKFIARGQANDFELLSVGTYLQEIKADKSYDMVETEFRLQIDRAIKSISPLYAPIFGLANALHNKTIYEAQSLFNDIIRNYQKNQATAILEKAIDQIDDQVPIEMLAYQLYTISKTGTGPTIEVIARAHLYLYAKFVNSERINDPYLLHFAFYLNRLQYTLDFHALDKSALNRFQQAVESLPLALQLVFFRADFCAQTINGRCRDIATQQWTHFALSNLHLYQSGGALHLQFNFANFNDRGNYGCMEFNSINFYLSQEGGRFTNWMLQFINNKLVFHSYGLPLCTRYPKKPKDITSLASECHFIPDDCTLQ